MVMNIGKCSLVWFLSFALTMLVFVKADASVVTDGLVSWWKFDETSGTTAADSYGSNNGTLTNFDASPAWTNDTPGSASSGALFFDGVNDVVDCGSAFGSVSTAMTAEVWIKHEAVTDGWDIYLTKYLDGNNRWYLRVNYDNSAGAYGKSAGAEIYLPGNVISTKKADSNEWHHVAFTASVGSSCVWYVDGLQAGTGTVTQAASFANTGKLLIGTYDGASMAIRALIDDVRVYNRVLSAEEILQNYRAINVNPGVVTSNLVSWWKLDETSGTKARDAWGGGYGTLLNFSTSPTWTNDTPGKASSGALWFDGANDVINTGNKLSSVSNALTTEVWLKAWSLSANTAFLTKFQAQETRWYQRLDTNGSILFYAVQDNNGVISLTSPSSVVDVGTWHHLVFTGTRNGTGYWYVDGEMVKSASVSDQPFFNTANLLIGGYNTGGSMSVKAVVDDVRIYDRQLTAEEVKQNYRVTIPGPPAGTLFLVN